MMLATASRLDLPEASKADIEAERKRRKRLQNRLNQRAHRSRLQNAVAVKPQSQAAFRIDRWRIDDPDSGRLAILESIYHTRHHNVIKDTRSIVGKRVPPSPATLCEVDMNRYGERFESMALSVRRNPSLKLRLSVFPDHLLHLINYNVFRGFYMNKTVLSQSTQHLALCVDEPEVVDITTRFPSQAIVIPTTSNIPPFLTPTRLQRETSHSTWIDLIPFPRIRDNLILREGEFDHWEFLTDVVGDLLHKLMWLEQREGIKPSLDQVQINGPGEDDEITSSRKGLILWGEPYLPKSWEATPAFLRKWAWVVEGCNELIDSTNCWRILRGEDPLVVE